MQIRPLNFILVLVHPAFTEYSWYKVITTHSDAPSLAPMSELPRSGRKVKVGDLGRYHGPWRIGMPPGSLRKLMIGE